MANILIYNTTSTDSDHLPNITLGMLCVMIIGLYSDLIDPFIPYTISVAGATIKGRGKAVLTDVFFTQEGSKLIENEHLVFNLYHLVPQYGPQNITGRWLNRTSIEVSWLALSLVEARGFITNYTVTAQPVQLTSSNKKREETSKLLRVTTLSSNETSIVIRSSLDPTLDYVISVSASTKIGESTNNINITLSALGKIIKHLCVMSGIFISLFFRLNHNNFFKSSSSNIC